MLYYLTVSSNMRASYSGNTPASQADAEGSIPFARSNNDKGVNQTVNAFCYAVCITIRIPYRISQKRNFSVFFYSYNSYTTSSFNTCPCALKVTTFIGICLPLLSRASCTAFCIPPQQGTSIRTTNKLLIWFWPMMAASFSE